MKTKQSKTINTLPEVYQAATFEEFKTNLIDYFSSQDVFKDYDFTASRINVLIDLLAYNTLYMQQFSNSALQESFIRTANLRSSIVQHAQDMGYYPSGRSASVADILVSFKHDLNPLSARIPRGTKFLANTYDTKADPHPFITVEDVDARRNANNEYLAPLSLVQGRIVRTVVTYEHDKQILIKDETIDRNYLRVWVDNREWANWTNNSILNITGTSTVFYTRETIDGHTEIYFGEGVPTYSVSGQALESNYIGGLKPINNSEIVIEYISTKGAVANNSTDFVYSDTLQHIKIQAITENYNDDPDYVGSIGGGDPESSERIRELGPIKRETQRRCVTASDYEAFVSERFGSIVQAVQCFTLKDKPGYSFISIKPKSGLTLTTVQKEDIQNYLNDYNLAPITPSVMSPNYLFIRHKIYVDYATNKLDESERWLENEIINSIDKYYENEVELFNKSFHKSRMLSYIDNTDISVLGSRAEIEMIREVQNFYQTPMAGISCGNPIKTSGVSTSEREYNNDEDTSYNVRIVSTDNGNLLLGPFIKGHVNHKSYTDKDFIPEIIDNQTEYYKIGIIDYTQSLLHWSIGSINLPSDKFNVADIELNAKPIQDNIYTSNGSLIVFEHDLRPQYTTINLEPIYQ